MTKAELEAHGTSPKTGGKPSLRGLSVYRSFSPSSAPSVYHCRPKGRRGPPTAGRHAGQPTDRHNGRRKGTGPTETHRNPGGGATRPISAARRPRAPPPGGAEPGNRRARGGPARPRGPPERGSTRGRRAGEPPGRAERRRATEQGARRNADRPGGPASGGAARPRRSGRAAPSHGPQAARAPPRATQGSRGAVRKKRRGAAPQARQRGTKRPPEQARTPRRVRAPPPRIAARGPARAADGGHTGTRPRGPAGPRQGAPRAPFGRTVGPEGRQRFPP